MRTHRTPTDEAEAPRPPGLAGAILSLGLLVCGCTANQTSNAPGPANSSPGLQNTYVSTVIEVNATTPLTPAKFTNAGTRPSS